MTYLTQRADLRELIAGNVAPDIEDPALVKARIVEEVLNATTEAEVFEVGGSTAAKDLKQVPFVLHDVKVMQSQIGGDSAVYVLLDAELVDSGERVPINTGAARIMAQAYRAKELGLLPKRVQVVEVAKARDGQDAPIGLAVL